MKVIAEFVKLYLQGTTLEDEMRGTEVGGTVETGNLIRGLKWFGGRWSLAFKFTRNA